MSHSTMLHSRQRAIALLLLAAPEGSLLHASFKLSRLLPVWLVMTSVSGDGHADLPHPGAASAKFVTIVLGAAGGLSEDNLTSHLLAPVGDSRFIALDAGTLLSGIKIARARGIRWTQTHGGRPP